MNKNFSTVLTAVIVVALLGVSAYFMSDTVRNLFSKEPEPGFWADTPSPKKDDKPFVAGVAENVDPKNKEYQVDKQGVIVPAKPDNVKDFLSGRTFWDNGYEHVRFYFAEDGTGKSQFFKNMHGFAKGDIVDMQWSVKGNELCLLYLDSSVYCQRISVRYTQRGLPGYTDGLSFFLNDTTMVDFELNNQSAGNLILNKGAVDVLAKALEEMRELQLDLYYGRFDPLTPSIPTDVQVSETTMAYLKTLQTKIMKAPLGYFRFREDGSYSSVLKGHIVKMEDDLPLLEQYVKHGRWWIVNGKYLCMGYGLMPKDPQKVKFAFCTLPLDPHNVMIEPIDGFITHSSNGFTMKHGWEKFVPHDEFEYFYLLK